MKWTKKTKIRDYRMVKRFALFPIRVNDEYKWLETCYILQERWYSFYEAEWCNISWVDKQTYLKWKEDKFTRCSCADSLCKYNYDGEFCMLGNAAMISNNGICYSKET